MSIRAAVLSVSSSRAAGAQSEDVSGPALVRLLERAGCEPVALELVADDRERIGERIRHLSEEGCALVATTGGTGLSPDDLTPEATRDVIEREVPGIAEAMRLASREHVPDYWMLSRGVAGTLGRTLVVNFPGNPNAIEQAGAAITPALPHALALLSRDDRPT